MPVADLNYLAILVAAVSSMIIGMAWYSPTAFGKQWAKGVGLKKQKIDSAKMNSAYALGFLATLVTAYVLAYFVDFMSASTAFEGFMVAFWVWLGFIATTLVGTVLWENKPWNVYFINAAYQLVALGVMGIILAVWI